MERLQLLLYKSPPGWELPSLSVACIQVETYLRLGKVHFAVHECCAASASPTGQVPALDTSTDLVGTEPLGTATILAEFAAVPTMLRYLKAKIIDLDRGLTASQRAEAAAFTALLEAKLQPAIAYTTWLEDEAFNKYTSKDFSAGLPFPLSYFMLRSQRKAVEQHFAGVPSSQVYQAAAEALDALATRLSSSRSGGGDFYFGAQPSSLDALLFGCLAFLRSAPVVHPQLQRKMAGHRELGAYVERLSQLAYGSQVPAAADAGIDWSAWGSAAGTEDKYSKARTEKETELHRKGRRWLICAAAAIAAYVFFSGNYILLNVLQGPELEVAEDDDDE